MRNNILVHDAAIKVKRITPQDQHETMMREMFNEGLIRFCRRAMFGRVRRKG